MQLFLDVWEEEQSRLKKELISLFRASDTNADGKISYSQVFCAYCFIVE
jgi:Ca2+-binding EF-hand superfamily protein